MKQKKLCPYCNATMIRYKHGLNRLLTSALIKFARVTCEDRDWVTRVPTHITAIGLTYNERANFQKLQYWGFIAPCDIEGKRKGFWVMTDDGLAFAAGEISAPSFVWTLRGNKDPDQPSGQPVFIGDVCGEVWDRYGYLENAKGVQREELKP